MTDRKMLDRKLTNPIKEATYLNTKHTHRYRPILRFLYQRHLSNHAYVLPTEIFEHLSLFEEFNDYTMEELNADLENLFHFNNLERIQDQGKAKSLQEYKNKLYRYKCTPHTVELEKMLIGMETSLHSIRGSLERTLPERLFDELYKLYSEKIHADLKKSDKSRIHSLWESVFERFEKLISDASDYLSHINSENTEMLMRTESFSSFKTVFIDYLQNFIAALKSNSERIQKILYDIDQEKLNGYIDALISHQKTIPGF